MLHDFYLYDYHGSRIKFGKLHIFEHSETALKNALLYFDLNKRQQNIIISHMFPLNITKIPRYIESWIVNISDKYCAIREFISDIKNKRGWYV